MPKDLGEYVIVHELVYQLAPPNHGRVFKLFLYAYMPDWEEREKRLQEYQQRVASDDSPWLMKIKKLIG